MVQYQIDQERAEGDADYREECRHRCRTDGLFLAPLLGFYGFTEEDDRAVADLYVQKKPGLRIEQQDTEIKRRMDIRPRGVFKTSYGVVDDIQWVITCPDITIAKVTGTLPLGKKLTRRTMSCFVQKKGSRPTLFQTLFPEYIVTKATSAYRAPCTTRDDVEPTLYSTSLSSNQTGDHPWIVNLDDFVTFENSGIKASDESRNIVWDTFTTNNNTIRRSEFDGSLGYLQIRNTRYHPFDAVGRALATIEGEVPEHTDVPVIVDGWKLLIQRSLTVKSGERLVEGEFPSEDEVILHFPKKLPWKELRRLFRESYPTFMCQQQNDPQGGGISIFPATQYRQAQIDGDKVPSVGDVRICWRLQSEAKPWMARYAEGVAVLYAGARVYVIDAWRGAYTPTELCQRIIRGCKKNQCGDLVIENTPGSDSMIPHIYNEATHQNWSVRIERPEFDMDDAVRIGRMRNLQPMMRAGRLWFSTWCANDEELRNQFVNFGMIESNGLIDCASRLALRIPISTFKGHVSEEDRAMHQLARENGWYERIYGGGGAAEVEQAIETAQAPPAPRNSYGLRPMLGGLDG